MIDLNTIISQALAAAVAQATAPLLERIAALESQSAALLNRVTAANAVANRLHERVGAVEQAVEQHCEEYDHNDFVTEDKLDEYVTGEALDTEVRDAVRDIMEGATVSIRI